ncbi:hypothetical protein IG609_009115 [Pectobacterium quasiaquaticum]|uniref:Phage tail protein C-terminal domain-containing protein n=1 Tax=Pectobacterium quasiaquaticum TaxID=2774015 RepID=A0A9Q2IFJ5_9GAMM|nr:hypothetical protein [Pectobacterium quasiaquaticum]URG50636.1 hypothetical protein IG609_009115 [Pectobacterium quasiaquaticum]
MSDIITPEDLPPINELDEFTANIPELQIDTDVLAGTGGPANFQAQALANRTKYLKRILDAVSLELNGINQAVATAQQVADASMKKAANGADIADAAQFRNNVGLKNAATHDVQTSAFDATSGSILINGAWGWGGSGQLSNINSDSNLLTYLRGANTPSSILRLQYNSAYAKQNSASVYARVNDMWSLISVGPHSSSGNAANGVRMSAGTASGSQTVVYELWTNQNLTPATLDTDQTISGVKLFTKNVAVQGDYPGIGFVSTRVASGTLGRTVRFEHDGVSAKPYLVRSNGVNATGQIVVGIPMDASGDVLTTSSAQAITGTKTFRGERPVQLVANSIGTPVYIPFYDSDGLTRKAWIGRGSSNDSFQVNNDVTSANLQLMPNGDVVLNPQSGSIVRVGANRILAQGLNAVADSGGFWKTASPVINIYSDGSFTTTDEAVGVDVKRLSEGVYKITGCQGMHPNAAWNGIDGGVSNPKCRNDKALLWNNYEVDEDGSITVYTFHRVHPDAMPFAQNRLTLDKKPFDAEKGHTPEMEWPDQSPIDVPKGLFIQVRVNMPERIEPKPFVSHSNVYCNSVSPAK